MAEYTKAKVVVMVMMVLTISAVPPSVAWGYCPPPAGSGTSPVVRPSPPPGGHHGGGRGGGGGGGGGGGHHAPGSGRGSHPHPPAGGGGSDSGGQGPVVQPPPVLPTPPGGGAGGSGGELCPVDALKLGVCADVLSGLVHVVIGDPAVNKCCPVLEGLLELEAALCLCTVISAKLLNLNIFLPLALELLATCGKNVPPGFQCPPIGV